MESVTLTLLITIGLVEFRRYSQFKKDAERLFQTTIIRGGKGLASSEIAPEPQFFREWNR